MTQYQVELAQLKLLVASRAPLARFGGETKSTLKRGEYRFKLMCGRSVYVQSPTTPSGAQRGRLGLWRFSLSGKPWRHSNTVDAVVDYIREQSELTNHDRPGLVARQQ